ncbi:MAG: ABC transporter permease [Gemmatimonadetes bacterium]|nr:ABC transporter permease [Gemmatimonadota bacterium]
MRHASHRLGVLVRKELLANLRTLRLAITLSFAVLLCVLSTVLGSYDYSRNVRDYEAAVVSNGDRLAAARTFQALRPQVFAAPQPLQILCRGSIGGAGQYFPIFAGSYRIDRRTISSTKTGDLMFTLIQVDFVMVVSLVLSLLAIVLGYDAICGEREQGTLRLALSHPVKRAEIVAGKMIGGVLSVWTCLATAFLVSLIVMQANQDVDLSGDDWVRLGMLFAVTALFLAEVYALSVLASVYTRQSATSLVICLFAWLVLSAGYSNALPAAARRLIDWPPWQELEEGNRREDHRRDESLAAWAEKHPPPGAAWLAGYTEDGVLHYVHPRGAAWLDARAAAALDITLERADRVARLQAQNQMPLARQQFAVERWSALFPITSYRVLGAWIVRATLDDAFEFGRHGVRYRRQYFEYIRDHLNATGWRLWYTDDPAGTPPMITEPAAVTPPSLLQGSEFLRDRHLESQARWQLDRSDSRRRLDLSAMPGAGSGGKRTIAESLEQMMTGLLVMILTLGVAVVAAVRRFATYEVD